MTKTELIEGIQKVCEEEPKNKFKHQWSASRWEKHGKDRLYINRTNGRNRSSQGYIDLNDISNEHLDMTNLQLESKVENIIEEYEEAQ